MLSRVPGAAVPPSQAFPPAGRPASSRTPPGSRPAARKRRRGRRRRAGWLLFAVALVAAAMGARSLLSHRPGWLSGAGVRRTGILGPEVPLDGLTPFQRALAAELKRQAAAGIRYQDGYFHGGDPPPGIGVCTDVVIRAFRAGGVDLRAAVAEDVRARRDAYRIGRPDPDIDHRRCRNLVVFFQRRARSLPTAPTPGAWEPGDLVFWDFNGDRRPDHVGMVATHRDAAGNPTVIHHWPGMPVAETDGLHRSPVTYHFRWPA